MRKIQVSRIQEIPSRARQVVFGAALTFFTVGVVATGIKASEVQILRSPPNSSTPDTAALGETLLRFQTRQYAVRIFRQRGILRLNLYNNETNRVEQRGVPMRQVVTDAGIVYTNLQGETAYTVTVAPDGSAYDLKIQQGDRLIYSEHVQNEQVTSTEQPTPPTPTPPTRLEQPTRQSEQRQTSALTPILDSETIARFQTPKYAVRIYSRNDELRMNLYNRRTDKVELKAVLVKSTLSSSSATYSYLSGNFVYSATVMPIGGYRLVVTQGDRIIYNEQGY